jgi:hypothetical protein
VIYSFGACTGLIFSGFTTIPANSINRQTNKIKITTQKTAQQIIIPIHARVLAILDKYEHLTENSLPTALSNARMNLYLKNVAKLAGINEKVSKTQLPLPTEVYDVLAPDELKASFIPTNRFCHQFMAPVCT